ncbi:MAG TPA: anti-sigma factor [Dyella sp.]|uniref:anti-sigma factor n=1 Tax=Dyella sp. TaxID=1869338 RepID=UPI002C1CE99F|nr:anti-sigma factor [Dyella sp.]HUB88310.1 anti-sigma factor [Dyella sp.]
MNEFEWLRQMRGLNQPVAPRSDLWSRIDAALDDTASHPDTAPAAPPRARHGRIWTMAASLAAIVVLACGVVWHMHAIPQSMPQVASHATQAEAPRWKPSDPRLAGAALELEAARMELQQAMQQAPDSPALQRLLQQTHAQQNYLRELEKQAG